MAISRSNMNQQITKPGVRKAMNMNKMRYQEGGDVKSESPFSKGSEISGITKSVDEGEKLPGEGLFFARMDESDVDVLPGLVRRSRKKVVDETGEPMTDEIGEPMKSGGMTKKDGRDGCAIRGRTRA